MARPLASDAGCVWKQGRGWMAKMSIAVLGIDLSVSETSQLAVFVRGPRAKFASIAAKLRKLPLRFLIPNSSTGPLPVFFSLQAGLLHFRCRMVSVASWLREKEVPTR